MTANIVAFLNRALDEEAETARRRLALSDRAGDAGWSVELHDPLTHSVVRGQPGYDPQATLDRVAALRLVLAQHRRDGVGDKLYCLTCATDIDFGGDREGDWPCPTLRALASAYRRHPDYDQAWLPDGVGVDA